MYILAIGLMMPAACSASDRLTIKSPAFADGSPIPAKYTCEGSDINPPLKWSGVDKSAKSLVLIVDDPDAPDPKAPKMTWIHWILYDIPATAAGVSEDARTSGFPAGTKEGLNSWKRGKFGGPCPPIGRHRYFFKLYSLDTLLSFSKVPTKDKIVKAMNGHILQKAELVGTYQKQK